MDCQSRITDLVPRRTKTFVQVFFSGCAVVAILELLYAGMPLVSNLTTDGRVATFDLDGEGSLAVWFSTFTLTLASAMALLVALVRREQGVGRGGYRIWLWAAACWLGMGIDECASVHEAFKELMSHTTGHRLLGQGVIWWVLGYGLVLGIVGLRLLWDMRNCRGSVAALLATAAFYMTAVLAEMAWILPQQNLPGVMLEEGCEMLGNLCLLLSMGLHARHLLDARAPTTDVEHAIFLLASPPDGSDRKVRSRQHAGIGLPSSVSQ